MTDRVVELRSDTFTRPSEGMRRAMYEAEVGDDVWNEDPTIHRLQEGAAEITGKEAALFVSSGTQANLIGLLCHAQRGSEVILGDKSHIFQNEAGGISVVGGTQVYTLPNDARGRLELDSIAAGIRGEDIHQPQTACIALENTHNRCGGSVLPTGYVTSVVDEAHGRGIAVHLDGARIFNAATALGAPVSELANPVDSVSFCLSKGLGAPVGSLLCGSSAFIARALRWRKVLGGGMRQAGILAAAGIYALEHNVARLADDHANARTLAEGLANLPGIETDPAAVQSNIVFFDIAGAGLPSHAFLQRLTSLGVRLAGSGNSVRAVTSSEVTAQDIDYALVAIRRVVGDAVPVAAG